MTPIMWPVTTAAPSNEDALASDMPDTECSTMVNFHDEEFLSMAGRAHLDEQ